MNRYHKIVLCSLCAMLIGVIVKIERKSNNMVILEDNDSKMIISIGNEIKYSYPIHGSVGTEYRIEYDSTAFQMSCTTVYDDPISVALGMCGGDKAVRTCKLRPLKLGEYTIKIIHEFRGDVERVVTHTITVI